MIPPAPPRRAPPRARPAARRRTRGRWRGGAVETTALRADGSEFPVELAVRRLEPDASRRCSSASSATSPTATTPSASCASSPTSRPPCAASRHSSRAAPTAARVVAAVTEEVGRLLGAQTANMIRYEDDETGDGGRRLELRRRAQHGGRHARCTSTAGRRPTWCARPAGRHALDTTDGVEGTLAEMLRELGFRSAVAAPVVLARASCGAPCSSRPCTPSRSRPASRTASATSRGWSPRRSPTPRRARSWPPRGRGSSRPATPSAGGSSATCTTARSSAWSRSRSRCATSTAWCERDPPRARAALASRRRGARATRSPTCASWRAACIPRCSPSTGCAAALTALAGRAPRSRSGSTSSSTERPREQVEAAAYFVVSEALTNVAKYAGRDVRARHGRAREGPTLVVEISDDGAGGADPAGGLGPARARATGWRRSGGRLELAQPGRARARRVRAVLPWT